MQNKFNKIKTEYRKNRITKKIKKEKSVIKANLNLFVRLINDRRQLIHLINNFGDVRQDF